MRALITGVGGFTGRYLAAELSTAGYEVAGLVLKEPEAPIPGVNKTYACNLSDAAGLAAAVKQARPDVVAHLAAISFVAHGDAEEIYCTNLLGTRHLLEALCGLNAPPRAVLLASSAAIYGNTVGVVDETVAPSPVSDYGVSKLAMEHMARLYDDHLPVTIVRPFNYTGVGQPENFLLPKIVGHALRRAPVIELGNLDIARDFSDVRIVVQFYRKLLECPAAAGGTFNICSGTAYALKNVLDMVREISGHALETKVNPAFVRRNEVRKLVGSSARLDATVGKAPGIPLRETLAWMLAGQRASP